MRGLAWFWPNLVNKGATNNKVDILPDGHVPFYWCTGNHEAGDKLDALGTKIVEVNDQIYDYPFASTLELTSDIPSFLRVEQNREIEIFGL